MWQIRSWHFWKHWCSVLALFQAGLVGAGRQAIAILLLTLAVHVLPRAALQSVELPLLSWSFLLTAIGCVLTRDRFLDATEDRVRRASQSMRPSNPTVVSRVACTQCLIAAAALAATGLAGPPNWLREVECSLAYGRYIQIAWSGVFSMGCVLFAVTAHAAYRAFRCG